jgi:hypothetical protein
MTLQTDRLDGYRILGIQERDVARGVQITPQLKAITAVLKGKGMPKVVRRIEGSIIETETTRVPPYGPGSDLTQSWPWYLQSCDSPDASKILVAYLSIAKRYRRSLPVEAFCIAANVPPMRVLELLTGAIVRQGANASTIIAAVNHPRVVEKTVEMALTDGGIEDRNTLHKAVGFLPTPKGAQTTIQVTQNAQTNASAQAASVPAPPPEATIRRIANRFNDARQLPVDTGSVRIPDILPHEQLDEAELIPQDDDEEEERPELTP